MERIRIITCKGLKILKADYSELDADQIIELFRKANKISMQSEEPLFVLADFSGTSLDIKVIDYLQNEESKEAAKHLMKTATLGLNGISRLALNIYNRATGSSARAFTSEDEAFEWFSEK